LPDERPVSPATRDQMRAIAHPLRLRLLEVLRDGPSTATKLAEELGESSGATSYHLRILAKAGLIDVDAARGTARDRWWRRRPGVVYVPTDADDPEGRALEAEARLVHLRRDEEALARFTRSLPTLEQEWRRAAFTGSFFVYLTADEVFQLGIEMLARMEELRRSPGERREDARKVLLTFRALPWEDEEERRAEPGQRPRPSE
jgi:DNA-binding transcriptional ArsR family regulator